MRIAIDARFLGPEGTGIGRYTEELVNWLQKIDRKNEYVVLLRKNNFDLFKVEGENFSKVLADAKWYSVREQFLLPEVIKKAKVDFVHFCHFNVPLFFKKKFIVTVHDLIKDDFKDNDVTTRSALIHGVKYAGYKIIRRKAVLASKFILVPSSATRDVLVKRFGIADEKIFVTHEAADPSFAKYRDIIMGEKEKKFLEEKYKIKFPYIFYVGNAYPHKNISRLLDALKFVDPEMNFVNTCARSVFYQRLNEEVHEKGLESRVILPGFIPDQDISLLYKGASAYVFPSLIEGFGLPLLEAQMAGVPVVASRNPPLPEVGGDAAIYFDPFDPKDIAEKINKVIADEKLRGRLISSGYKNVERFSWKKTAEETLAVYEKVV